MSDWNKRISRIAMGIALTGIGIVSASFMLLAFLVFMGVVMEDAKQFPLSAMTVGAAMAAAVWFLSDRDLSPREWILRFAEDFRYRLLATGIATVWVLIGAWWFYRGLSPHPYAIFYLFTGALVLLWQLPALFFFLALHTKYFREMTQRLMPSASSAVDVVQLKPEV